MSSIYTTFGTDTYALTAYLYQSTSSAAGKIKMSKVVGVFTNKTASAISPGNAVNVEVSFIKGNAFVYTATCEIKQSQTIPVGQSITIQGEKEIDYEFTLADVDKIRIRVWGGDSKDWETKYLDRAFAFAFYRPDIYKYTGINYTLRRTQSPVGGYIGVLNEGDILYSSDTVVFSFTLKDGYYSTDASGKWTIIATDTSGSTTGYVHNSGDTVDLSYRNSKTALFAISCLVERFVATLQNSSNGHATARMRRINSPKQGASVGYIESGDTVYHGDVLKIEASSDREYTVLITPSEEETVTANITFVVSVSPIALINIFRNGKWEKYSIYVGDGEEWRLAQANIRENGEWSVYS